MGLLKSELFEPACQCVDSYSDAVFHSRLSWPFSLNVMVFHVLSDVWPELCMSRNERLRCYTTPRLVAFREQG